MSESSVVSKEQQKEADKAEATKRGITYKEVRQERRSRSKRGNKAVDELEDSEHGREIKRMRAYSKDLTTDGDGDGATSSSAVTVDGADDGAVKIRRRTRSVDIKEERLAAVQADRSLTVAEWHAEHAISIRGHGKEAATTLFPEPYREFKETPYCPRILESFVKAGFTAPTAIQAQSWPIALQGKDMICVAKTGSGSTYHQ